MAEVILDLGEFGEILIESSPEATDPLTDGPTEKTGFVDTARRTAKRLTIESEQYLKRPLTGLVKLFLDSLPQPKETEPDPYELAQFSLEFNLGIKGEVGGNMGAVAKVMPEGAFKCTYTWKRKAVPDSPTPDQLTG